MQKALIAFDSKQLTLILSKMLGDFGFEALTASSLEQLTPMILENQPAVLFVDWTLNGQDIEDILNSMEQKPATIFVSAQKSPQQIQHALNLGANEYIMKPFDNDILQSKLSLAGLL